MHLWQSLAAVACATSTVLGVDLLDASSYAPQDILTRDVAIIGGGSTGVYAAVRLRDYGKNVAVIERQGCLGGHAQTFTDPVSGERIDIGVLVFDHLPVVTNYFRRFHIGLTNLSSSPTETTYTDFDTGETVKGYQPPNATAVGAALQRYGEQLAKYPSLQKSFNTTYPIAPDLLLPFGEFVTKYNLADMMPSVFIECQGYAPILNLATIYMIKYLNAGLLNNLRHDFLTPANNDTASLYQAAGQFLGAANVLLNSTVLAMDRTTTPLKIAVSTPSGTKLLLATKLISSIPPLLSNLQNYDLVAKETALFAQFSANGYYTGLLNNTGIVTAERSYVAAAPNTPDHIPTEPGLYSLNLAPNTTLTHVYFASPHVLPPEQVQAEIAAAVNRLRQKQGFPAEEAQWAAFKSHSPFNLEVSVEAIANGFYEKLYRLNGERATFWNGAAFQSQDSSVLWQYTEDYILPIVLGSLDG